MSIHLNKAGFDFAKELIADGKIDVDPNDAWAAKKPDAAEELRFIEEYGYGSYGHWHLGMNTAEGPQTQEAYSLPIGDFKKVVRSALVAAAEKAEADDQADIRDAANLLIGVIDDGQQQS